jgi:hypothetical protein
MTACEGDDWIKERTDLRMDDKAGLEIKDTMELKQGREHESKSQATKESLECYDLLH